MQASTRFLALTSAALVAWSALPAPARADGNLDQSIVRFINKDLGNGMFDDVSRVTSNTLFPVLVPVGLAIGGGDRGRRAAVLVSATGIVAFGAAEALKLVINRPRPYQVIPDLRINWTLDTGSSFPSAHTAVAFGVAAIVSDQYPELWVQCLSYSLAGVVGWSRIYRGDHYLTDVIAGGALGYGTAKGVLWLRDVVGLHEMFPPGVAPQVSWSANGTPLVGLAWRLAPAVR